MAKLKQSTSFDIGLLEYASKTKILKPVALFYQVKSKYRHSIIYHYTPNKLSKMTGLHRKTVTRYVKKLTDDGFCELRDGNLLFKAKKVILPHKDYKKSKYIKETRPYTSFDGILKRIYTILILNNKEQQKFKIVANYGQFIGKMNPRTFKKALRKANIKEDRGLASSNRPVISLTGVSRLLNVSRGTSFKIMRGLKKKNYLKMTSLVLSFISPVPAKYYTGLGHCFRSGKYIKIHLGREVKIGCYNSSVQKVAS